jgi:predicted permease
VLNDLSMAFRSLRKSPGFTLVAVLTLAIGIGANTAIFSVVQGVLLAPLPYRQPDRLVDIWLVNPALKYLMDLSYPDFLDWQRQAHSFEKMAAFAPLEYDLTSPGTAEHVSGQEVSAEFFDTLGVRPALGREFTREEDRHGGAPAVIISDRLWKERLAGSAGAIGKSISLSGTDYTVVGVVPPSFHFGDQPADVYTPIGQRAPLYLDDRTIHDNGCIARLKPGVSQAQAQAEMDAIQQHIDELYPAAEHGLATKMDLLQRDVVGDVSGTLLMLLGAVGVVLLIACANVANLLLARSAARAREFGIRSALGASRARIVRQLLTESVMLSLAGAALALAIAGIVLKTALAFLPGNLPRSENIGLNLWVLLFTLGMSIVVGVLFGLAPALRSSRPELQSVLSQGGRGSTGEAFHAQKLLVISQMALTLVLLAGAGLLLRTIHHLWKSNPGFQPEHVLTFKVGLSAGMIKSPEDTRVAYQQLLERIRRISGVEAADLTALLPLSQQDNSGPFWFGSQPPASMAEAPRALYYWIGPEYLQTMKIPLLRGRYFTADDTTHSERVVIIDSRFAEKYFPGRDPIGQHVTVAHWGEARIIGVAGHVRHWGLGNDVSYSHPQIYASFYELPDKWVPPFRDNLTVVVRTPWETANILPAIKQAVYGAGSAQPVYAVETMQELVSSSMSAQRLSMMLLGTFAGLALLLAAVGMYGVISYTMTQRFHEFGIRMALGAGKKNIFRLVITQGLRLALLGVIVGAVAALLLARLLSSFSSLLYQVSARDPLTFATVALLLSVVAILACYVPARRAAKVDPMTALRWD